MNGSELLKIKNPVNSEFYPSISAELLEKSINFARSIIEIEDKIEGVCNDTATIRNNQIYEKSKDQNVLKILLRLDNLS